MIKLILDLLVHVHVICLFMFRKLLLSDNCQFKLILHVEKGRLLVQTQPEGFLAFSGEIGYHVPLQIVYEVRIDSDKIIVI